MLLRDTLVPVEVQRNNPIFSIYSALKKSRGIPAVDRCLAKYKPGDLSFSRLDPPIHQDSFEYGADDIIANAEALIGDRKKSLRSTVLIRSVIPADQDEDLVSLAIETPPGTPNEIDP